MTSTMKQLFTLTTFINFAANLVLAKEITIYDSTTQSNLGDWTIYPTPSATDTYTGWLETGASYERKFQVCQVQSSNQNNWLRTRHIERKGGNRIQVELEFSMYSCEGIDNVLSCRETFDFYYIEANQDYADSTNPVWAAPPYIKIKRIAAEGRFSDPQNEIINTVVEDFGPVTQNGFYLALQDQGACMALLKMRVFYTVCPQVIENFANFPETVTGLEVTSLVSVDGTCVENASIVGATQPVYQCKSDGSWILIQGTCACNPGYEPVGSRCQECSIGKYKPGISLELCSPCPLRSHADSTAMKRCTCDVGYFRAPEDASSDPCTGPPSAPRNVKADVNQETSVITLTWSPPNDEGGRSDVTYWIECRQCPSDVKYTPDRENLNSLDVNISRLSSYTEYEFQIHAKNGVSDLSGIDSFAQINATTFSSVPSSVRETVIAMSYHDAVSLDWKTPLYPNGEILDYEIRYYIQYMRLSTEMFRLKAASIGEHQNVIIGDLASGTDYIFQVRARTEAGFGSYSYPIMGSTLVIEEQNSTDVGILAGVLSTAFVLFAALGAAIILRFWKGRKKEAPPAHVGIHTLTLTNGELLLPNICKPRIYIDPSTYGDPDRALQEFTTEVDSSNIRIMSVIGGGEFGDVCSGLMKTPDGYTRKVAVKMLKPGASEKDRTDFLMEASIMGQFDHPNVIKLMGVITKTRPAMIVTDFMENGALDSFLRENDGQFTLLQLLSLLRGIACGMRYLSEMNYVHRDLAARNILVDQCLVCRVADFGLSRIKEEGMYESSGGGKIPVRWTAPEAITYKKFTSSSDVWSYGIVTWEVMSYGERPYWNWGNHNVIDAVQKGYCLPPPMECPECIYELMLDCWERDRLQRPTFSSMVSSIDRMMKNPSMLQTKARPRDDPLDPIIPSLSQFHSVPEWLEGIKMGRYKNTFIEAGYHRLEDIARLSTADLTRMGIVLLGHQKKIMKNIELLRQQLILSQATFV
ncbi:ephrin type-B receptor 1-B-like [Anneissia japonica]|uniref:ephrin type-B receptor 1-B-like n=1 Tax=Anneissia japonica TaxID=1529436 RepID=UPI001425A45D|nr:ephrin type-B receptor 1-B-like [Anneissia japonica]